MQFQVKGHCSIVRRGGAGELLFRSKVISIVRRGGAGELLFRSKVIAQLSGEGVRVNCFSGQRSFQLSGEGVRVNCFQVKGQKVAGKCWIVSTLNCIMKEHSRTFRKVKKWRENAGLFVSVLIVDWSVWCTVSSKSKPIKEAGFRKKLSFGKYSPRV